MSEKKLNDQTAFETAGIPTPPDQENVTATDMLNEAVEEIMDNIREPFDDDDNNQHEEK